MFLPATKNRLTNSAVKQIRAFFPVDTSGMLRKEDVLVSARTAEKDCYILRNGVPIFKQEKNAYIPTVKGVHLLPGMLKRVVVDAGAIKYLINGADVMAPGLLHSTSEYPPVEV
ncbi:malignant T-cell-amplified sequence, partial [Nematocida major]|uniref:malignant T-cell-amplified sequence n=1 Tax=Nematocida major TaxID=1912982 RepID=UPI0020074D03